MLVMVALQQYHLIPILLFELNDLYPVFKHLVRPILDTFILIRVQIIAEEDDSIHLFEILFDRPSPEHAAMHIGYYQYTLCHSIKYFFNRLLIYKIMRKI